MNSWAEALKEYNKGKAKWTIPKKGTKEYEAVKALQSKNLKGSGVMMSKATYREFRKPPSEKFPFVGMVYEGDLARLVRKRPENVNVAEIEETEAGTDPMTPRRRIPKLTMSEPEIIEIINAPRPKSSASLDIEALMPPTIQYRTPTRDRFKEVEDQMQSSLKLIKSKTKKQ